MQNKRRNVILITIVSIILLCIVGTYAFIQASMNTKNQEATITTGTLALTFEDGTDSFQGSLDFGSSAVKTFSIENTGTLDASAVMYFDNLINTYTLGSLTYTLEYKETEDGNYTEILPKSNVPRSETSTSRTLSNSLMIPSKQKYYYRLTITLNYLSDIDQTSDFNAIFSSNFRLEEKGNKALDTVYTLGLKTKEGSPDFSQTATTDETSDGLYSMEDDYGTSYYYRGAVENNYVKFAGFYWRIIRINGDGSIRLIYDGTKAHANGDSNIDRLAVNGISYNTFTNDNKSVGYMYSPASGASTSKKQAQTNEVNSNAKIKVDEWYKINIEDKNYSKYISDTLFCNDRSTAVTPGVWSTTSYGYDTTKGYGLNSTVYGPYQRYINPIDIGKNEIFPSLKCKQENDRFTYKDTEIGNASLVYPVGMITVDEVVLAGSGKAETSNTNYYLYKGYQYWTMSPGWSYSNGSAGVYSVYNQGQFLFNKSFTDLSYYNGGIAPVINIKAEYAVKVKGSGNILDPYTIE